MWTWRGTPKPSFFYLGDLESPQMVYVFVSVGPAQIIQSEEIWSVESLVYLVTNAFEILVEEENFQNSIVCLPKNQGSFAAKSKKLDIMNWDPWSHPFLLHFYTRISIQMNKRAWRFFLS